MGLDIEAIEDLQDEIDELIFEVVAERKPPTEGFHRIIERYRAAGEDAIWDELLGLDFEADRRDMDEMAAQIFTSDTLREDEQGVSLFINEPFFEEEHPLHERFGESTFFLNAIGFADLEEGEGEPVIMALKGLTAIHDRTVKADEELWGLGHMLSLAYASLITANALSRIEPKVALGGVDERQFVLNFEDNVHPLGWMTPGGWIPQCSASDLENHAGCLEADDTDRKIEAIRAIGRSGYLAYDHRDRLRELAQSDLPAIAEAAGAALALIESEIERCGG